MSFSSMYICFQTPALRFGSLGVIHIFYHMSASCLYIPTVYVSPLQVRVMVGMENY